MGSRLGRYRSLELIKIDLAKYLLIIFKSQYLKPSVTKILNQGDPILVTTNSQAHYKSENSVAECDNFPVLLKNIKLARHNC